MTQEFSPPPVDTVAPVLPGALARPRKLPFRGLIERIDKLTYDVRTFRIRLIEPATISFRPGQNIRLQVPPYGNNPQPTARNYSIASIPSDSGHVDIIMRYVPGGVCTTWAFEALQEGDEVTFSGPYGKFALSDTRRPMIWLAGGSGMGPFWSMLRHMKEMGIDREVFYFFGAVGRDDLMLYSELRQFEAQLPWFFFMPALSATATDDAWAGERGLITDVLGRCLPYRPDLEAYICGPQKMIDKGLEVLRLHGFQDDSIFCDNFGNIPAPALAEQ